MREFGEIGEHRGGLGAGTELVLQLRQRRRRIAAHDMLEEIDDPRPVGQPQHVVHGIGRDRAAAMGDRLVENRQRVAHRALRGTGDCCKRLRLDAHTFLLRDHRQMGDQFVGGDAPEIEALAARQDGDRHLADLGRREDELHMLRRLLQGLQQAVEGRLGEHVHFVDDIDLVGR